MMMYYDTYGNENKPAIVFLHGANFVHTFGRQYGLSDAYYLLVPHIMGYGKAADSVFDAEAASAELVRFICSMGRKVTLIGFSLGAQLAVKMIAEHAELLSGAIVVSPWLIKNEPELSVALEMGKKQLRTLKNKGMCNLIGLMNGLPKQQRKEFISQMQAVQMETVENTVYNNIALKTVTSFQNADIPIMALAGAKEQKSVIDSVKTLGRMNRRCRIEIWDKAAHNIPPVYAKRFIACIHAFMADES